MALESASFLDELNSSNPTATDNVSQGDDHIRLLKSVLKASFPSVDIAVNAIHTASTAPALGLTEGLLWIDTSGGAGSHVAKIYDGTAFITLPFSVETANKVDIDDGTIDGTTIGATTASTAVVSSLNVNSDGATVTGIKDEDDMASDSAVKLATQQSIKAYVDTQLTAEDLDLTSDSGTIAIDLDSETLTVAGGEGIDTSATGNTVTITGEDASTTNKGIASFAAGEGIDVSVTAGAVTYSAEDSTSSNKGVASFSTDNFLVTSGDVTIKDAGVANAELADMAANTVKVRDANSTGVPSDKAVADTEILIGDGTGFTAAALSGDATMTNAGAVSVVKIQGQDVSSTAPTNDQYMKYSTTSNEWQMVTVLGEDKLTTKGDLLVYNTVDSETRLPVGTDGYLLTARSTATNGVDWEVAVDNSAAMALALGG